ncbi:MAG: hypothetical protein ACF8MF_05260 [Phycisphaerales bacterium JB052]
MAKAEPREVKPTPEAAEPETAAPPNQGGGAAHDARIAELQSALAAAEELQLQQFEELKGIYRRLHIELDTPGRSSLIVELFDDPRPGMRLLGFELADRDLSASKELGDAVGESVRKLLKDDAPAIRAKAARLITRLVPPDGMIVLTQSLQDEHDPIAVEPMLLGIARWPNRDAHDAILSWFGREDAPLVALCSAAWALEREGLIDSERDSPLLLTRLRSAAPQQLREDGMKLLAKLGSAEDLRTLIALMLSDDPSVVRWAATALVETPRSVEVLAQSAMENETLYLAAAESLIKHRATPEGLRRLAELPQGDPATRRQMLERMGQAIDRERLGEAVRLAQLDPELSISILSRLVANEDALTPRSAKGVLQLAELQLNAGRPNRVNEALLALEGATLEPTDQARRDALRVQSLILLNRFDEAIALSREWSQWNDAIERAIDDAQRHRIAQYLLNRDDLDLTPEQTNQLQLLMPTGGANEG